jgi:hypothetical protein
MSTDHQIINGNSHFDVLAEAHIVRWPDGSSVDLHAVQVHGFTHNFLRALRHEGLYWVVVDLRKICPTIEPDLHILPRRDHQGAVLYNLRADYRNASAFTLAAMAAADALWAALDRHTVARTSMVPA